LVLGSDAGRLSIATKDESDGQTQMQQEEMTRLNSKATDNWFDNHIDTSDGMILFLIV
jgi:hypothetical protein